MLHNTSVTIFNKYKNPDTKKEEWIPTVFEKCLWTPKTETLPTSEGFKKVNMVNIFINTKNIPKEKTYIEPEQYMKLPLSDLEQYFTFDPMKGYAFKGGLQGESAPLELAGKFTIQSALFYDYGLSHWEVVAK